MHKYKLRFVSEKSTTEFEANLYKLARDINRGFVEFVRVTGCASGCIEVWHPVHGWAQMTIDGTYPIVSNPIHLNFDAMGYGIIDTYAMVSARPPPKLDEEKQRLKSRKNVHLSLVKA